MPSKSSSKRILIAGCGQIGSKLAKLLSRSHQVWGLKLSAQAEKDNIEFISADVTRPDTLSGRLPDNLDYLVYCLTPGSRTEQSYQQVYSQGLQNLLSALPQKQSLTRLYFISSTSVYSQNDASWVDENSPTDPVRFSGRILLQAEAIAANSKHPATIIRFSGIYGGARKNLIEQVKNGIATLSTFCRLSNRIHEQDCVGFIHHLLQEDTSGRANLPLYLASDSEPVDLNNVLEFLAMLLSVDLESSESNNRPGRAGNKRCCNKRMLESGYALRFPSYREGYRAMLENM